MYSSRSKCGSEVLAVHLLHRNLLDVEVFQAADVDRGHRVAGAILAPGKRLDAAMLAEAVLDDVLVERIGSEIRLAAQQREFFPRGEPQQPAASRAHRAIAGIGLVDLAFHLV